MKIYDISQEIFGCTVYPGDPVPQREVLENMEEGALYNLTAFSMCAHNGTHIDAPRHFIREGKTVDELPPEVFFGPAYVAEHQGSVTAENAYDFLRRAREANAAQRLLIKGEAEVSLAAAEVFATEGLLLLGNESQSVGPLDAPMAVHCALLGAGVVLLEGVRLAAVPEGAYLLSALPLNLGSAEGAPCRAVLAERI